MANASEDSEEWWENLTEECRLMQLNSTPAKIRITAEIAIVVGAFIYLSAAVREARFLGLRMFFENLVSIYIPIVNTNCTYRYTCT